MVSAMGGAQIDKFIKIVSNTRFSQNGIGYQTAADAADGKAVRPHVAKDMVGGFRSPTSRHELELDGWLAGDMLLQERYDRPCHRVRSIAGLGRLEKCDRLSLIKRSLRKCSHRENKQ